MSGTGTYGNYHHYRTQHKETEISAALWALWHRKDFTFLVLFVHGVFQLVGTAVKRDGHKHCAVHAAYMEIGSGNVSAVVGPYRQAVATATLKFGIPYFVVDIGEPSDVEPYGGSTIPLVSRPYNLISVLPHPSELYSVIVEVLATLQWSRLAVIYEDRTQGQTRVEYPLEN